MENKFRLVKVDFDAERIMYMTDTGFFGLKKEDARILDREDAEFFIDGERSDPKNDNLNGCIFVELIVD